jgi:protein-tyrosine phosphatase
MHLKKLCCLLLLAGQWQFALANINTTTCDGTQKKPCLVRETQNNTHDIRNWRTAKMIETAVKAKRGNITGLDHLWMSGSGATSINGFTAMVVNIHNTTDNKVRKIIDVDLRQESHGYLDSDAITITAENNWGNLGKTRKQVFTDEKKWLKDLSKEPSAEDVLTPAQFKSRHFQQGISIPVKTVKNEKEVAESRKLQYFRLTVTDYMAPTDEDIDRFVELVRKTKPDTWLHFHCLGGDGRSTTFMVMYDMLHNADKVPLEDIIKRQAAVAPFYNVLKTDSPDAIKVPLYQKRALFIRKFYIFSQAYLNGYIEKWSTWSDKHRDL